jgi:DNA polymerase-3 subunit epsilon
MRNRPRKKQKKVISIPAEVTAITGITDDLVAGHAIDDDAVAGFAAGAHIVIAHNASFDRKFAERFWPVFADKHWACSMSEIDWKVHGLPGARLAYLSPTPACSMTPIVPSTIATPSSKS